MISSIGKNLEKIVRLIKYEGILSGVLLFYLLSDLHIYFISALKKMLF